MSLSGYDGRAYVELKNNDVIPDQRDIDLAIANEEFQVAARAVPTRRWRRLVGQVGHFLVAVSERPLRATNTGR